MSRPLIYINNLSDPLHHCNKWYLVAVSRLWMIQVMAHWDDVSHITVFGELEKAFIYLNINIHSKVHKFANT